MYTAQSHNPKPRILVIEDETDILELIRYNFEKEGYDVQTAASGEAGLCLAEAQAPDLVLLDLMLPGIDGLQVCRTLKARPATRQTPIIIVSAKGEESEVVAGLELGADDYITKPFTPKILSARAKAVLRRQKGQPVDERAVVQMHEIFIDPVRFEVRVAGEPVALTATEFKLLHYLARHPGWVFTRYQIVDATKGEDYAVTDRAVDVQIVGLRRKLGVYGRCIETVRGVGYRFVE